MSDAIDDSTTATGRPTTVIEVARHAVGESRITTESTAVGSGDVRLRIDRFAVTANNITYAVFGDMLGYWDFFPTGDPTFGRVPAMGWATVVESNVEAIAPGQRYYGWFPMATDVVMTATPTRNGFRDDGPHRSAHAAVYRAYVSVDADPMYPPSGDVGSVAEGGGEGEDRHALLRGLFLTGFLAEEFFADGAGTGAVYFGAARVIVLSASSKTAIGFAQRSAQRHAVDVVGVTSSSNREMVEALGFYDQVVTYDDIATIPTDGGAVSIDMAGDPTALAAVHAHFGDGLAYSMTVGRSHHDAAPSAFELVGPTPQLFFAPSEVARREEQWGRDEYGQRCAAALTEFVDGSSRWLTVEHRVGVDAAESAWRDVYDGVVGPAVGLIATLNGSFE